MTMKRKQSRTGNAVTHACRSADNHQCRPDLKYLGNVHCLYDLLILIFTFHSSQYNGQSVWNRFIFEHPRPWERPSISNFWTRYARSYCYPL